MSTNLKPLMTATDKEAQYDQIAKNLLGQKIILAHILKRTVDEFREMAPIDIVHHIEGDPLIMQVPVDPGYTNKAIMNDGDRIIGLNTENQEVNEGLIRFDIIFYVRMIDGLSQIIINIEAQKDEPKRYKILNRAIFYVCRMISSQKEREFRKDFYDDIRQVYSIWVCMKMNENSLSHIHLTQDNLVGSPKWKGTLGLLNIVMIGLTKELPPKNKIYELHRLLGALLSSSLPMNQRMVILEDEYVIPMDNDIRKGVSQMSNLGHGVWEDGREEGRAEVYSEFILKMHNKGYTIEEISDVTEKKEEEIQDIINRQETKLATV